MEMFYIVLCVALIAALFGCVIEIALFNRRDKKEAASDGRDS